MAGRPRKNNASIDEMIKNQEEAVLKAKAKYEFESNKLKELLLKRDEQKRKELLKAIEQSGKSYDEIMAFVKG